MHDLRTALERLGERVIPSPEGFERLERRRRRRARNRRIGTAIVALAVAAAGSLVAFSALQGGEPRVTDAPDAFFALWPETTYAEAKTQQDLAAQDDASLLWRTRAETTAGRFARVVLRWEGASVTVEPGADQHGGPVVVEVETPPVPCPSPPVPACFRTASITLARLVDTGPSGIWSVVAVSSPGIPSVRRGQRLETGETLAPGSLVQERQPLTVAFDLPDGTNVYVAFVGLGECAGWERDLVTPGGPLASIDLPRLPDEHPAGCDVAFMVFHQAPAMNEADDLGDQTLSGTRTDRDLYGLLAIPLRIEPTDAEAPTVAGVTCDGEGTIIGTPVVAAQADGVHIRVSNIADIDLSLQFAGLGGDNAFVGEHEIVWPIAPGQVQLRCSDPRADAGSSAGYESLDVVDPSGLFVPPDLGCSATVSMISDYGVDAVGAPGDPVDIARDHLTGLASEDVVERAGYPGAITPLVRVVRRGRVIARLAFQGDQTGGWLLSSLDNCDEPDSRFGWADTPYPRGWFEWCPQPPFVEPGRDWSDRASEVAMRFAQAYAAGDRAALDELLDPSVPGDPRVQADEFAVVVPASDGSATVGATSAAGGEVVRSSCGPDVDAYSVAITIDDGTDSASADFTVYLVLREDGWKVWGTY